MPYTVAGVTDWWVSISTRILRGSRGLTPPALYLLVPALYGRYIPYFPDTYCLVSAAKNGVFGVPRPSSIGKRFSKIRGADRCLRAVISSDVDEVGAKLRDVARRRPEVIPA
jgi:hypothetical protein